MTISQELFRFVTLRRPERWMLHRFNGRLVRDLRPADPGSLLSQLMGPGAFHQKLSRANSFAQGLEFVRPDHPTVLLLDRAAEFFRRSLAPGMPLADLKAALENDHSVLAGLLKKDPTPGLLSQMVEFLARLWDSLYAQTIRGCDRYVSTNYLADGLRVYHVLRLLWLAQEMNRSNWPGGAFDDYEILIDLEKAAAGSNGDSPPDGQGPGPFQPHQLENLKDLATELVSLDSGRGRLEDFIAAGAVEVRPDISGTHPVLVDRAAKELKGLPAFKGIDLATTPVNEVVKIVANRRMEASLRFQRGQHPSPAFQSTQLLEGAVRNILTAPGAGPNGNPSPLSAFAGSFYVPLAVGQIRPPVVGDLLLVEQDLQRYVLGEIADIKNVMRGERKEHSTRDLSRTSQTTTTETSSEREETQSLKTDERFQLSTEAQKTATQSFSADVGVNVSGKFGPVQVGVSANASFSTSKSASESTAQEFAKTVTEEASQRVRESIKQTSSVTLLTESLKTSLHGFNNEKGSDHVIGIYRWVDKIYTARTMNYGRRLMLVLEVPEPAAFFRSLMAQDETALLDGLVEPVHPARINIHTLEPIPEDLNTVGFNSYQTIDEDTYAELAALYDVTDVAPPPPDRITGAKAIVYPDADQADVVKNHEDEVNELSLVWADNTLMVDPNYELSTVGVYAPTGENGGLGWYADSLKLGMNKDKENRLLVQVGDQSFYFSAIGQGNNDPKQISTNFNTLKNIDHHPSEPPNTLEGTLQTALPIAISADFEGIFDLNVVYTAELRPEALDAWKAQTYAAIVKGYLRKKQEYDQALKLARANIQSETESKTYQLREEQYRSIETTELKRGAVDLLTKGSALGHTPIVVGEDGSVEIVYDEAEGSMLDNWRSPLANGSVVQFFEKSFSWSEITYQFHPYFWTDSSRWKDLVQATSGDLIFEQFLKAGSGTVVVPVEPGYERPVIFFLKTGRIWDGGYLPLFTDPEMLEVYSDVEQGVQLDPPEQVGESWEVQLPTSLVMLQEDSTLPVFEVETTEEEHPMPETELAPEEGAPF